MRQCEKYMLGYYYRGNNKIYGSVMRINSVRNLYDLRIITIICPEIKIEFVTLIEK